MSVYTTVKPEQLRQFLQRYELGPLQSLQAIAAGITNTNYYVETADGSYVLTLYEHHSDDELDYMLGLQRHLAGAGVGCAAPLTDRRGSLYSMLNQRPAAIIERLPGTVQKRPTRQQCAAIGAELARFHQRGLEYNGHRANPRGVDWILAVVDMLETELDPGQRDLIEATLMDYRRFDHDHLPGGAIHADLFHDNALFVGDRLGGVFDFDYACSDSFVLDIAILMNDWCIDASGALDKALVDAVLDSYQQHRRLERLEIRALPLMLRFGALRFWISRLHDSVFPMSGELTFIKDPAQFRRLLELRSQSDAGLERLFLPHDVG